MNTTNTTTINLRKPRNQFAALPEADRKLILELCSAHSYEQAAEILRKPRSEGGLGINTSAPALCRYFTNCNPDLDHAVLAQLAAAANIRHEQINNAFLGAIRATVQARVFENLRKGRALADMEKDFRLLRSVENLYLADAQFRARNTKTVRASYDAHIRHCAESPEADFAPIDDSSTPVTPEPSPLEQDILKEREALQELLATLQNAGVTGEQLSPRVRNTPAFASIPPSNHAKSPVIPPIPPNSTSNGTAKPQTSAPSTQPKPTPHIAPPKINRNDPCTCGSGRKSKKCCHR
jgi:hypothetical protein